ncbi:HD-GYP domain-containing protein [Sphingopyxis sp.]|uniref:HD-GYP domain-containing protein n=1 Tax=Sphingopyxis sp. TaxID=1908224 RepID=UPI002ED7F6F9
MFQPDRTVFEAATPVGEARLAEILGAFSYALDLTEGQPAGHSVRAAWIGTYVGLAAGLADAELADCLYAVLLKDLGCSSNAARVAELFLGDDRTLKQGFKLIGPGAADFLRFVEAEVGVKEAEAARTAARDHLLGNAAPILTGFIETRCTQGAGIARRLRFSDRVAGAIAALDEHWDGGGMPRGLSGSKIPLLARIALLAQVADVFFMAGGPERAVAEVRARAGGWLDPDLTAIFADLAADPGFWAALAAPDIDAQLFALEPAQARVVVDEDYLDDIAAAFGQVIDAKSPYTGGHSGRVALLTDRIGAAQGIAASERRRLVRCAMLHDIGKLGVSNRILDKPGRLTPGEWVVMQGHAQATTDILSRIGVMRDMVMIAGSHHERLDGTGYPLGLDEDCISMETRIVSVADFFDALTADRPYRAAMPVDQALSIMACEVGAAIDGDCFDALEAIVADGIPQAPLPAMPVSLLP